MIIMSTIQLCKCPKSKSKIKGVTCGPHVYGIRSWRSKGISPWGHPWDRDMVSPEMRVDEVYCLDATCKELKNKWVLETIVDSDGDFTKVTKYQNGQKHEF